MTKAHLYIIIAVLIFVICCQRYGSYKQAQYIQNELPNKIMQMIHEAAEEAR